MLIISCHHVYIEIMYVNYGMPTYLINTLYSYVMSSCLHSLIFWTMSFHIFYLAIIMWNSVMLSCLGSHHICEIVSCYPVWLDNIDMNYFMPSFIPHYPLHLSIIQCLYIQLHFLFISHLKWRRVMAVSKGVTTWSSEKIVLPVDADRTTVVLAQGPDPPHITHSRRLYPYPVGQRTSYTPSNPNPGR